MFAERSGTDLDKTDAACRNDREPFMKLTETGYAKINLGLDVLGLRPDKYHEVAMVMQTVSLSDTVTITENPELKVTTDRPELEGGPSNLAYKAAVLMGEFARREPRVHIHIEKRIFLTAGLAGGSTDAAGTIYGLNKLAGDILSEDEMHKLCSQLGSDLNVCLKGGCIKTSGRGEILEPAEFEEFNVSLIKPVNLGISAKEAYTKFGVKIKNKASVDTRKEYVNDLEWAIIGDYTELQAIKAKYPKSIMTGSGSTYFMIENDFELSDGYWVKNGLKAVANGVKLV
jgi:4-diphosphocytidyl-2-C-methyl-D-erythritol kinase